VKYVLILKSIVLSFLGVLYTGVSSLIGLTGAILENRKIMSYALTNWAYIFCGLTGLRVKAYGLENIPEEGALYAFNHTSHMDIAAICRVFPKEFRFGAKEELFKIPLFGHAITRMHFLKIARGRRTEVIKVYQEAKDRFKRGENFMLSPEGTRQDQDVIAEFKSGPFIFAIEAGVKIVPTLIVGAHEALPKGELFINSKAWVHQMEVHFLEPVDASEYSFENRHELKDKIRELMVAKHKEVHGSH
jgi:1-acyl-sn-glycerol-3-phosphate acyltransferase